MNNITTNDAFHMYGSGITDYPHLNNISDNAIYNSTWPIGNQCIVGDHKYRLKSAMDKLLSGEQFRIDCHTGDTASFMAFCDEMHINCDNECSNHELMNRLGYKMFKQYYIPKQQTLISKLLFGKPKKQMTFNTFHIPQKHKWMWWNGTKLEVHETYLGLTDEQIKEIDNYINE